MLKLKFSSRSVWRSRYRELTQRHCLRFFLILTLHHTVLCSSSCSVTPACCVLRPFPSAPQGKYFYITPGICPGLSIMRSIVESAGGKLLSRQPSFRKIMEHRQNKVLLFIALHCSSSSLGSQHRLQYLYKQFYLLVLTSYSVTVSNESPVNLHHRTFIVCLL